MYLNPNRPQMIRTVHFALRLYHFVHFFRSDNFL